jgi:AraC-like DNA-binding protein
MVTEEWSEAETAIRCYERWSGLVVVVHDLTGRLAPLLPPGRIWHTQPLCKVMKTSPLNDTCTQWEIHRLRPLLAQDPVGRIQVCHAGLVELVVPVLLTQRLALVLFAGQRLAGDDLMAEHDAPSDHAPWSKRLPLPAPIAAAEAAHALEGLRQLAARLHLWLEGHHDLQHEPHGAGAWSAGPALERRRAILGFIDQHHGHALSLGDLADHLGIGPHRTAHVVRELCDKTFVELVTEARLRTACSLLLTSDLPVPEIAARSGFGDANHFHRVFRRHHGITPHRYRRATGES